MNPIMSTIYTTITIGSLILIELLKRKFKISPEYTRRAAHIIIGTMGVLGYILGPVWLYALVIAILALALIILRHKNALSSITGVKRKSYGDIFLPLGLLIAIPLAHDNPTIYIASILITTYADSLCGIISDLQKKSAHTPTGSLVFALATFIILAIFTPIAWHHLLWISITLTIVEYISKKGSDNLTIPAVAGLLLLLF